MEPTISIHHEGQEAEGFFCALETWEAALVWLETQEDLPQLLRFYRRKLAVDLGNLAAELATADPPAELARHFAQLAAFVDPQASALQAGYTE